MMTRPIRTVSAAALCWAAALLWVLFSLVLRALCWRRVGKPLLATVLLVSALAAHFIGSYGVLIDKGMIRNVLETDWREAADLSSAALWWDFAWRGLLPAALLLAVPVQPVAHPTVRPPDEGADSVPGTTGPAAASKVLHREIDDETRSDIICAGFGHHPGRVRNRPGARHSAHPTATG